MIPTLLAPISFSFGSLNRTIVADLEDHFTVDNWTDTNTQIVVNTGTAVMDYAAKSASNQACHYDLTTVSDTAWVLRFKIIISTITDDINSVWLGVGISNSDGATTGTSAQEAIAFNIPADTSVAGYRLCCPEGSGYVDNTANSTAFTRAAQAETLYVELSRQSATQAKCELFSNSAFTTSLESQTKTINATLAGLRYIKVQNKIQSGGSGVLSGTIDDILFYNNRTTVP